MHHYFPTADFPTAESVTVYFSLPVRFTLPFYAFKLLITVLLLPLKALPSEFPVTQVWW